MKIINNLLYFSEENKNLAQTVYKVKNCNLCLKIKSKREVGTHRPLGSQTRPMNTGLKKENINPSGLSLSLCLYI